MMQIQAQRSNPAPKPQWTLTRGAIILTMPVVAPRRAVVVPMVVPVAAPIPKPQAPASEPNAHVLAYRAQRDGTTPERFIRLQRKVVGISYRMLVTKRHPRMFYQQRKAVLEATASKFPELSSPQLGVLFQRHHSAILHTLGRTARAKRAAQ